MKEVGKDVTQYFNDFQFEGRVSGGAELILHNVNRVLSKLYGYGYLDMLMVYFINAFNVVDRSTIPCEVRVRCPSIYFGVEFLYGRVVRLYLGSEHIMSAIRV